MIPPWLLMHTVTVVKPAATTDAHGNSVDDWGNATRVTLAPAGVNGGAHLQQIQRLEYRPDGRNPEEQRWTMFSTYSAVNPGDRVEWADHPSGTVTFEVEGPPAPWWEPTGYHHLETTLRVLDG